MERCGSLLERSLQHSPKRIRRKGTNTMIKE